MCGETSCICGHFGEAVEPTAEPGLLVETHACDECGMRSEGWVTMGCGVIGESGYVCDHFGEAVKLTVDPGLSEQVQIHDRDGMSPIEPVVMVQGVPARPETYIRPARTHLLMLSSELLGALSLQVWRRKMWSLWSVRRNV